VTHFGVESASNSLKGSNLRCFSYQLRSDGCLLAKRVAMDDATRAMELARKVHPESLSGIGHQGCSLPIQAGIGKPKANNTSIRKRRRESNSATKLSSRSESPGDGNNKPSGMTSRMIEMPFARTVSTDFPARLRGKADWFVGQYSHDHPPDRPHAWKNASETPKDGEPEAVARHTRLITKTSGFESATFTGGIQFCEEDGRQN